MTSCCPFMLGPAQEQPLLRAHYCFADVLVMSAPKAARLWQLQISPWGIPGFSFDHNPTADTCNCKIFSCYASYAYGIMTITDLCEEFGIGCCFVVVQAFPRATQIRVSLCLLAKSNPFLNSSKVHYGDDSFKKPSVHCIANWPQLFGQELPLLCPWECVCTALCLCRLRHDTSASQCIGLRLYKLCCCWVGPDRT